MALYAKGSPYTGAPFDMFRISTGRACQTGNCWAGRRTELRRG